MKILPHIKGITDRKGRLLGKINKSYKRDSQYSVSQDSSMNLLELKAMALTTKETMSLIYQQYCKPSQTVQNERIISKYKTLEIIQS